MDRGGRADAESLRRIKRAGCHEYRSQTDQRVEGCDELRHRRHRDGARAPGADARRRSQRRR